ncbi:hypothetical protein GG804_21620 [Sphingomonas histidinilytica]|uniref:hypothetical protein n=1 Tax=Rhizorhabdus histidinilytica TaxID=439228 RepID=UPI001ADB291D|nr:hypothetical protein [Rhizorhabdus histidinilytica]MBO9379376.1 hypothetical protein [Rhizorhabdus histidinilytica]
MPIPEAVPAAPAAAIDAYPDSYDAPVRRRLDRRTLAIGGIGLGVYLLTLLATAPARIVAPLPGATGTIWHGAAPLDGGSRAEWRWSPLASLTGLGFAADVAVTGPGTALAARALLRPGRVLIEDAKGSAGFGLLAAIARPGFACDLHMQVDLARVAIGGGKQGADGRIRSEPGSCNAFGGPAVAVPAMTFDVRQTPGLAVINLAPAGERRRPFIVGGLEEKGMLRLIVTAEGAATLPFLSPPGGMKIETEL